MLIVSSQTIAKPLSEVIRCWPSEGAETWVKAFLPQACSNPQTLAVVVFGSAVRCASYSADLDLLVIYDEVKPRFTGRPIDVDIRWFRKAQFEQSASEGHELVGWIVKYGEVLCERAEFWSRFRREWLERIPFPSAEIADQRAARAEKLHGELVGMGDIDAAREQFLVALTQQARAYLIRSGVFPASRPELPDQLREIREFDLAARLEDALRQRQQAYAADAP